MKKLRWGVLSTANIAQTKVMPAIQHSAHNELVAISSRTPAAADNCAGAFGLTQIHHSYEALLDDPNVDAIYNPLPNHLHVDWSIKALEAGKHVLCEKPLGLNTADAQRLVDAANNYPHLKVMEAFMYRFHPQWQALKQLVDAGELGKIRTIHSHFSYNNRSLTNIRNIKEMGGGALLDIGCYCVSLSRWLFNEEPLKVIGAVSDFPDQEVDCLTSGILSFSDGTATFTCATKVQPKQYIEIYGEEGSASIEIPFNPPADQPARLFITQGEKKRTIEFTPIDQYGLMVDAFALSVLNNTPVSTPLSDAINNMRVIDAIFTSVERSSWVKITD